MKELFMHHNDSMPEQSLGGLLDRCGHFFSHRIGSKKRGQDTVLALIARHPGITQKALSELLGIQPASVSELLTKLERKGLILREKYEQDRRSIRLQLTQEGQRILDTPEEAITDPFQALTEEEQEQLRSLLEKLLADWHRRYPTERGHHGHKHHNHHHDKENDNG